MNVGPYRVIGPLDGATNVYEAESAQPRRTVALRLAPGLDGHDAARFAWRVERLAQLWHPGIARHYGAGPGCPGGEPAWLATERIHGASVRAVADTRELDRRARLGLLATIADALHHAHMAGVIHGDLGEGDIVVTRRGEPKIIDFRVLDGPRDATVADDVTALGALGRVLLPGPQPADVEAILAAACGDATVGRYTTAEAVAADLRRARRREPIVVRPPTPAAACAGFVRRYRVTVAAAAVLLGAVLFGTVAAGVVAARDAQVRRALVAQPPALTRLEAAR